MVGVDVCSEHFVGEFLCELYPLDLVRINEFGVT